MAPLDTGPGGQQRWVPAGGVVPHPAGTLGLTGGDGGGQAGPRHVCAGEWLAVVGDVLQHDHIQQGGVVEHDGQGHGALSGHPLTWPVRPRVFYGGGVSCRDADEQRLRDLAVLRAVRDRIDREYAQPLNVDALARDAHMSSGHLSREFKRAYGEAPYSYLMTRRIERAMTLLRLGDLSVTEVCFAVGCSSLGTFSTRFRELVGVSPGAYRREHIATAGIPSCVAKKVTRPVRNREA